MGRRGGGASLSLAALNGSNGFRLDGIDAGDQSGLSASSAGDVNGDGIDDLIIAARYANGQAGESYVVFGTTGGFSAALSLSALDGSNGFRIDGIDTNDFSGFSVSSAGDVNGDGIDDLIIGAWGANGVAGESYVVFGTTAGFSASLSLSALDGSNGFRLDGIDGFDLSGFSVSSAGDVNGDGIDDLIIGAQDANGYAGESYVIFGREVFAPVVDMATVTVTVNGVNDAPEVTGPVAATFSEDDPVAMVSLLAGATDPEGAEMDIADVSVVSGDASGLSFLATDLTVTPSAYDALGAGQSEVINLSYKIIDEFGEETPQTAMITITGVGDAPSIDLSNQVTQLAEDVDTGGGLKAADIVISDVDGGPNTLSLSGADAGLFEIIGTVLHLKAGVVLDFESDAQFDVVVEVDDPNLGVGPEDSVALTIDVLDVNEPPVVDVRFTPSELPEDTDTSSALQVGTIVVYDDALGSADLSLSGADVGLFEIEDFGLFLRAGAGLDFETNPVLDVTVRATDPTLTNITTTAPVSINITDADETAPPPDTPDDTGVTKSGGPGGDRLTGTEFDDELFGFDGDDTLIGGGNDDLLNGGAGDGDVAVFSGPASNYTIEITPDGVMVADRRADGDGTDTLVDIETIRFTTEADGSLGPTGTEFDLDSYSAIASLTEAQLEVITQFYIGLYDRAPDAFGLFFWATQLAMGLSEAEIAEYFINSPEAIAIFGAAPTNSEIVESAFQNFFDRMVDGPGQTFWTGLLDRGVITIPEFFTLIDEGAAAPTGSALDVLTLQDQVDIGLYFSAINGLSDVPDATAVLALYDNTDRIDSIADAKGSIDTLAAEATASTNGDFLIQLAGVIDNPYEMVV